jgi:hypothetical protein
MVIDCKKLVYMQGSDGWLALDAKSRLFFTKKESEVGSMQVKQGLSNLCSLRVACLLFHLIVAFTSAKKS